jgi:hypothetical protein
VNNHDQAGGWIGGGASAGRISLSSFKLPVKVGLVDDGLGEGGYGVRVLTFGSDVAVGFATV